MKLSPKINQIFSEDSPRFTNLLQDQMATHKSHVNFRKKIIVLLSSKPFEYFMISLIIFYCILVFVSFGITDIDTEGSLANVIDILVYIELGILVIFILEICANIYAYGFKFYFRDRWLFFDAIVIIGSIILVIVDLSVDGTFNSISKIVRAIFRLLRIFLLFRKVNQFKKIKISYSRYDVKSPIEKIIEILSNLKERFSHNISRTQEIDWCIEIISSNRLYDPLLENLFKEDPEKQKEMLNWISNYVMQNKKKTSSTDDTKCLQSPDLINGKIKKYAGIPKDLNIPSKSMELLRKVDDLDFNCFEYDATCEMNGLVYLMFHLFEKNMLFEKLNINQTLFMNFLGKIQKGYLNNPYHNVIHAIDVTQTTNFILKKCNFYELAELNQLEIAAMYIASSIHDYEHPGTNNAFQISTKTYFAIRYNDKSVLENHHVSAAFINLQEPEMEIFSEFSKENYQKIRERIIAMVLSTDMASHFGDLARLKGRLSISDFDIRDKDKNICMEEIIHASDISNPMKPFGVYTQWIDRVLTEFWNQGDQERNLGIPISYLMDRYTVNTSKSQMGFIDVIVQPTFEVLKSFLPNLTEFITNLETNKHILNEKVEFYNENLKLLNEQKEKNHITIGTKEP